MRDILIIYLACKALKSPSDDLEGYILNLVIVLDASPQSKSPEECISATQCYCLKNWPLTICIFVVSLSGIVILGLDGVKSTKSIATYLAYGISLLMPAIVAHYQLLNPPTFSFIATSARTVLNGISHWFTIGSPIEPPPLVLQWMHIAHYSNSIAHYFLFNRALQQHHPQW